MNLANRIACSNLLKVRFSIVRSKWPFPLELFLWHSISNEKYEINSALCEIGVYLLENITMSSIKGLPTYHGILKCWNVLDSFLRKKKNTLRKGLGCPWPKSWKRYDSHQTLTVPAWWILAHSPYQGEGIRLSSEYVICWLYRMLGSSGRSECLCIRVEIFVNAPNTQNVFLD